MLIFDIETGPLPEQQLREICPPFVAPPHPGEFDPASVKYGNLKDQAKRDAKLEECREAHAKAVADYDTNVEAARAAHFAEFIDKAALSPMTGEVVAIGYQSDKGAAIDGVGVFPGDDADEIVTEAAVLENFWQRYSLVQQQSRRMVGWNINGFDLNFIWMRSIKLGVEIPTSAWNFRGRWFNWDERAFFDLMLVFSCGGKFVKLDDACQFLGCGGKNGEGRDFARLWHGTQEERSQAESYLLNDLAMTAAVAKRLGIC